MKNNMERLVKELQERFGEEYEVVSVKVPKNKEVLDGFQISRRCTGYGIIFYPNFEREPDNYADFWEPIIKKYFKKGLPVDLGEILKPGFILSHLQMRLVSISRNEELLKQYKNVIVPELDLAILFNVNLNEEIDMLIPTKYKGLDVSDEELYRKAYENDADMGYKTMSLDEAANTNGEIEDDDIDDPWCMRVIRSAKGWNYGSSVLLHKDVLQKCADELGTSLILIPSSVRELIYIRDNAGERELDILQTGLLMGNMDIPDQYVLSSHLYRFDRDTQEVTIVR